MSPNCINKGQPREWLEQALTNELPGIWLDGSRRNIMRLANSLHDSRCWLRGGMVAWLGQLMTGDRHHRLMSPLCLHGPSVGGDSCVISSSRLPPEHCSNHLCTLLLWFCIWTHLSAIFRYQFEFWSFSFISQSYILHPTNLISCHSCEIINLLDVPVLFSWIIEHCYKINLCFQCSSYFQMNTQQL